MSSSAAKLEQLLELYKSGAFCKCSEVETETDEYGEETRI